MPALSFEVGAVFSIDPQPAITSLEAIGQAFSTLETMLQESVTATASAVNQMVTEIGRLADAWRAVGMEARAGAPGGGGVGTGGGGGGGGRSGVTEAERQIREDRRNADAINRNEDQIYSRQEALARRENEDRGRAYANQRLTAEMENREFDRVGAMDDGITIPPPPRTGITEITRARDTPGPRNELSMAEDAAAGATGARLFGKGGHAGGILRGMGPLIGGLATWEAEKGAMEEDRALTQAMQEMGFTPGSPGYEAQREQLRGALRGGTSGTIYSESKGANVLPGTAGQFGAVFATPEDRLKNYSAILPSALRFAEVAEQYHRGSLQESLKAAISYSHMTHRYGSDELGGGLDHLLALSLATGETVAGEQGILKYSVPLGMAAGMGPDETSALTGFFQVLGFSGTTAATGLGQMLMGLTQTGGPLAAQHGRQVNEAGRELTSALHLSPGHLHAVHQSRGNQHVEAMQALGLFDTHGHVNQDVAPGGKLNRDAFLRHIEQFLSTHDPMTDLSVLRNAFTVRGSREAAMLQDPAVIDKLNVFLDNMSHPKSATELQAELQKQALPEFMQMLANIANIGNTLATTTLPGLNNAFTTMNAGLVWFNQYLRDNPLIATLGGYGLLFGGIATTLGLFGLAARTVVTGLGVFSGTLSLLGATSTSATAGLAGLTLGVTRLAGFLGLLSLKGDTPGGDDGRDAAQKAGGLEWMNWQKQHPSVGSWIWQHTFGNAPGSPDAEHHLGLAPPRIPYGGGLRDPERHAGATGATQALANTNNITINAGVITESTKKELLDWMSSALRGFLERASEMAQGAHQSQYDYSGGH